MLHCDNWRIEPDEHTRSRIHRRPSSTTYKPETSCNQLLVMIDPATYMLIKMQL